MRKRSLRVVLPAALAIAAIAGCGGTPGEDKPNEQTEGTPAEQVKTEGFEDLGPVTLTVISAEGSGGPQDALRRLSRSFEEKYPNVTVKISFRDFAGWTKQAKLVASSDSPPDVFAGNQGYQLDGELVKAGLIVALDEYAKAYGWDESYTPETLQQFEWTDDGKTFGEGTLWAVAQTGQSVGVFANRKKLDAAGIDPASLETFDDFEGALAKLRESLPADDPVIMLGNLDQFHALHLWGGIQGAYVPAQDVRDWIFQRDGATFDTEGNLTALEKLKEWADKGYLGKADAYNSRTETNAGVAFGKGQGALLIGGNWHAATAREGLGDDAIFFNMPPGEGGDMVNIGSTSFPMHISAKTENPDLAAAYLDHITGPDAGPVLVDTQQVPAAIDSTAEPGDPLGQGVKQAWDELVESGGLTLYPDWSSPTMLQTMGQTFQEMLAGRISPEEVAQRVQEDWDKYHEQLAEG
jgi:raffinose/stachyose/melibiose transport system substrate-binding protein